MKKPIVIIALSLCLLAIDRVAAVELLTNGNFELAAGNPPGWTLFESPGFDTAEQVGFADIDQGEGELGLWLKPFAGGEDPPGTLVDAVLSQTVSGTAGEGYSFSGWSRWEFNYAGGVDTLDAGSPFGAIPSPTRTEMELAFLDSGGAVIDNYVLDLRTVQNNFDFPAQHLFDDEFGGGSPLVAPSGTANIRVSASMIDGAFNLNPQQSAFFDDFSLVAASAPMSELLANGNLDTAPPEFPGWTVIEDPDGVDTVNAQSAVWAQNENTAGSIGAFLHPWANGGLVGAPNDAIFSQTVPGVEGGSYSFSAWSKFEGNFSGGVETLDGASPNGAVASPTDTTLELAFLDENGMEIGAPVTLDIGSDRDAQTGGNANDGAWYQHTVSSTAPAGTVEVRVTGAMIDGVFNVDPGQSAFFDDFSLDGPGTGVACDFDGDGNCNGVDADALVAEIVAGTNDGAFDLTGDGLVNLADRDEWLTQAGAINLASGNSYLLGDANLDGIVDGLDFIDWNTNKFTSLAAWTGGDFNADGVVDGLDFIEWNTNKFMSADGVVAVPEPSACLLLLVGFVGWIGSAHRK